MSRRAEGNITKYGATGTSEPFILHKESERPSGKQEDTETEYPESEVRHLTLQNQKKDTELTEANQKIKEKENELAGSQQRVRISGAGLEYIEAAVFYRTYVKNTAS